MNADSFAAELCCSRADIQDGQSVLELGCGWGSLCLYIAAKYPNSKVTAVSNSRTQKEVIDSRSRERQIHNLQVVTADVVEYQTNSRFDRVMSVEMFEHMKNYKVTAPAALLCVQSYAHQPYCLAILAI